MLCIRLITAVDSPLRYAQPLARLFAEAGKAFAHHARNLCQRAGLVLEVAGIELDNAGGVDVRIDQSGKDELVADTFDASLWAGKAQRRGGRPNIRELARRDGESINRNRA